MYYYGLLIIAMVLYLLIFVFSRKANKDYIWCVFQSGVCFFAYKHGFTKADSHMYYFFAIMPFVMGLLYLFAPACISKRVLVVFILCAVLSSFYSYHVMWGKRIIPAAADTVNNIVYYKTHLAERKAEMAATLEPFVLPGGWPRAIVDSSIQLLPWELLYAPTNDLKGWQLNPILQIYSAYTQKLDNVSATSLAGSDAAEFVLYHFEELKMQNAYLNNPATLNALFENYAVEKCDYNKKLLLLKRESGEAHLPAFVSQGAKFYDFDQWINIPVSVKPVYAKIKIRNSLYGKMATTFFRAAKRLCSPEPLAEMNIVWKLYPIVCKIQC